MKHVCRSTADECSCTRQEHRTTAGADERSKTGSRVHPQPVDPRPRSRRAQLVDTGRERDRSPPPVVNRASPDPASRNHLLAIGARRFASRRKTTQRLHATPRTTPRWTGPRFANRSLEGSRSRSTSAEPGPTARRIHGLSSTNPPTVGAAGEIDPPSCHLVQWQRRFAHGHLRAGTRTSGERRHCSTRGRCISSRSRHRGEPVSLVAGRSVHAHPSTRRLLDHVVVRSADSRACCTSSERGALVSWSQIDSIPDTGNLRNRIEQTGPSHHPPQVCFAHRFRILHRRGAAR